MQAYTSSETVATDTDSTRPVNLEINDVRSSRNVVCYGRRLFDDVIASQTEELRRAHAHTHTRHDDL